MATLQNGIFPAFITPLDHKQSVRVDVAQAMLAAILKYGAEGIYLCGTTGEGIHLPLRERQRLATCLAEMMPADKQLLVHVGGVPLESALLLAEHAAKVGATAISSLPPPGSFSQVQEFYTELAARSPLPLVLYYFPRATPEAFPSGEDLLAISQLPNIGGVKFTHEDLFLLEELALHDITTYNGRDQMLAAGLLMGANGGIGSTYTVMLEHYVSLYESARSGNWTQAAKLQRRVNAVTRVLLRYPLLAALKVVMKSRGYDCGPTLAAPQFESLAQQRKFLEEFEVAYGNLSPSRAPALS